MTARTTPGVQPECPALGDSRNEKEQETWARAGRRALGTAIGVVVWLWMKTLRLKIVSATGTISDSPSDSAAWIICFFHGSQVPLFAWKRRRKTVVLVSHSKDGDLQSASLRVLGIGVARGSSSRGGALGLRGLIRAIRTQCDVAMAVDGPRGPVAEAKEGSLALARTTRSMIVPTGTAAAHEWVLERAWDKMRLPKPFSRVVIVFGDPCAAQALDSESLSERIAEANARARALLEASP